MLSATVFASVAALGAASAGVKVEAGDHLLSYVSEDRIQLVNSKKTTWKAATPIRFKNTTVADMKHMLGTFLPTLDDEEHSSIVPQEKIIFKTADSDIPESFDVRTNWPQCASISGLIRDQSNCGSCWAFGSTEAFNDRHCIQTGDASVVLSPEDTLSCCYMNSKGCSGGYISGAWR